MGQLVYLFLVEKAVSTGNRPNLIWRELTWAVYYTGEPEETDEIETLHLQLYRNAG